MKRAAVKRNETTTTAQDDIEQYMKIVNARRQFFSSSANMGWRLAITVVIPIVAGVKLDQKFNTAPSLTLSGLILASVGAVMVVYSTVKEVNQIQAEEEKKEKQKSGD